MNFTISIQTLRSIMQPRTIVAAAIMYSGKVWTLPKPARHHDIIKNIFDKTGEMAGNSKMMQGFLDVHGTFIGRKEALRIALAARQVKNESEVRAGMLFSEDLW